MTNTKNLTPLTEKREVVVVNVLKSRTITVLLVMILAVCILFGMAACNGNEGDGTESSTVVTQAPEDTGGEGEDTDESETKGESEPSSDTSESETKDESVSSSDTTETETNGESKPSGDTSETETKGESKPSGDTSETETKDDSEPSGDTSETETKDDSEPSGSTSETEEVTEPHVHSYDEGVIVKEPTCKDTGIRRYTCTDCGEYYEKKISATDKHSYDEGIVTKEPTLNEEGIRLHTCAVCGRIWEQPIEKLPAAYTITLEGLGEYRVDASGKYILPTPEIVGYEFIKWTTADGSEFAASGTIKADITVIPVFEILRTTTIEQLVALAGAGAEKILIDADIVVDRPIFIVDKTTVYSEKNVRLVRDPSYAGDFFVVGIDENDVPSVLLNKAAELTLISETGTLTVDGNRDNMTVTVVGSSIFVTDSATVNIHDGAVIANNAKDGNERAFICTRYTGEWLAQRAGGAAILILNGEVNMYGGVIENNWSRSERTIEVKEDGTETWHEHAGCGGAIYNCGNFNMYGGIIRANESLRGGAIYNDEIVRLFAGEISENISHSYGGAIASSSSTEAQMFIGTEEDSENKIVFSKNVAETGGALYSNTDSAIVIFGNAVFEGNYSQYGGGAIYTAGGLTIRNSEFIGNTTPSSGGAIYFHYNYKKPDKEAGIKEKSRRKLEIDGCTFEGNTSKLGGAIVLSATQAAVDKKQGSYATIKNSTFTGNSAESCGALYVTRWGEAYLTNVKFTGNSSTGYGGAMSSQTGCTVTLTNVSFENNEAGNGGAFYIYDSKKVTLSHVDFLNNKTTTGNGGAIYFNAIKLTLDSTVRFIGNSSVNHGGAIYASYITRDEETRDGAELVVDGAVFENNTALTGGAISARTASTVTIKNTSFNNCSTPEAISGTDAGGGAIYSNNSTIDLTDVKFDNCASGYYGGTMMFHSCQITMSKIDITNASGGTGAALYVNRGMLKATDITVNSTVSNMNGVIYVANIVATIDNLTANGNVAVNGGVIYASGKETVLDLNGGKFENNTASNGAAIYVASATVNVNDCEFKSNIANHGGAIFSDQGTVNVTGNTLFDGNGGERVVEYADGTSKSFSTKYGGAVYSKGSSVNVKDSVTFKNNTSLLGGGAIYSSDKNVTVKVETDDGGEGEDPDGAGDGEETEEKYEIINYPAALTVSGAVFENNGTSGEGGAIYLTRTTYSVEDTDFNGNKALWCKRGGGAIYSTASSGSLADVSFINNSATKGGAVALHSESTLTVTSMTAKGNRAEIIECTCPEESRCNPYGYGGVFYLNSSMLYLKEETDSDEIVIGGLGEGEGNVAVSGGAIFVEKNVIDPVLDIHGAEFIGNVSTYEHTEGYKNSYGGGAIRAHKTNITLSSVLMEGNVSQYYGGALHASSGNVTITGSTFKDNEGGTGAALYFTGMIGVSMSESTVVGNVSSANGTMYASNSAVVLDNVTAKDNKAASGGFLYLSGSASTLTVNGGLYENNSATYGGAMYISAAQNVEINDATFKLNKAESKTAAEPNGGAIYTINANISVTGSTFDGNSAENHGGAIAIVGGEVALSGENTFKNNVAGNHGGAIHVTYQNINGEKIGALLTMNGGLFEGNKALGGGAVSIRSNCRAEFVSTVFKSNSVTGDNGVLDGDFEGGGAIYAGWGSLVLDSVEMSGNSSDGHFGGAVDSLHSDTLICGSTKISGNTNGVFVLGRNIQIKDNVNITGNTRSNVYLSKGRRLVLVGDIKGAEIGVMANAGAFVIGDGENVTDVLSYADCFEGDLAPVYKTEDSLLIGFNIVEQPLSSNTYTFKTNGAPVYQWYVLKGETWEKVEGATQASLENAKTGNTYKCIATITKDEESISLESTSVLYTGAGTQTHAVCGESCTHGTHDQKTWYPVSSADELLGMGSTGGSYYLTCDVEVDASVVIRQNVDLCLNGYKISAAKTDKQFSILTVKAGTVLNLTDCTETEHVGYVEDGKWIEGTKKDAEAVALKGGIVMGGYATHGGAVYSVGEVNVYNVNLVNNVASNRGGAIYTAGGVYSVSNTTFLLNGVENSAYGGGALYSTESTGEFDRVDLIGNYACKGGAVALHTSSKLTVKSLNALGNRAEQFVEIGEADQSETRSLGIGGVFFVINSTLELSESESGEIVLEGNTAYVGGAVYSDTNSTVSVSGAEFKDNGSVDENTDENGSHNYKIGGGAIYINGGSVTISGSIFDGNESGYYGGAIHIIKGSLDIGNDSVFRNNRAGTGSAVYALGGFNVNISDTVFEDNETKYNGAIYANQVTLKLEGVKAYRNTASNGAVLYLSGGTNATLDGCEFGSLDNGNSAQNGGAIYASGVTVTVNGSNFTGNNATGVGGAIYATGTSVELNSGNGENGFYGNNASHGGAIYGEGANVKINKGIVFDANTTANHGGAIYLKAKSTTASGSTEAVVTRSQLTVNGVKFTENVAGREGGALYLTNAIYAVTDTEFEENEARSTERGGGAIYTNDGSEGMLAKVSFLGNHSHKGGAVALHSGSKLTVSSMTAKGNYADEYVSVDPETQEEKTTLGYGGVIYLINSTLELKEIANDDAIVFGGENEGDENRAKAGGAIYIDGQCTVTVGGAEFIGNVAANGGAIYAGDSTALNIADSVFSGNSATNKWPEAGGGAIYANGCELTLTGVTLDANGSGYYGGALQAVKGRVTISDCVVKNSTGGTGAALHFTNIESISIENTEITSNKANANGVIYVTGSAMTLNNMSASENSADQGGLIYASGASNVVVKGDETVIDKNTATNGGAIYVAGGSVTLEGATLSDNSATNGGAIYVAGGSVTLEGATLSDNSATNGGAICTVGGEITAKGGEVSGNSATNGGAIYVTGGSVTLEGATLSGNSATSGGAVYVAIETNDDDTKKSTGSFTSTGVSYTSNTAANGGAIYSNGATVTIHGGSFTDNTATDGQGGAIYATTAWYYEIFAAEAETEETETKETKYQISVVVIDEDCYFGSNKAIDADTTDSADNGYGGAIYVSHSGKVGSTLDITGGKFENNSAKNGGAIAGRTATTVTLNNVELTSNESATNGGAIFVGYGELRVKGSEFTGNTSGDEGGAIYMSGCKSFEIYSTEFTENSAKMCVRGGGAIYMTQSVGSVKDVTFTGNTASKGGAIAVHSSSVLTVYSMTATDNKALAIECTCGKNCSYGWGGAIYLSWTTLNIEGDVNISNNSAVNGGGIYCDSTGLNVSGKVVIDGNTANGAANNVYIPSNKGVIITGELDAASKIGVTTEDGEFAWGDGENVTDAGAYADNFYNDGGRPVYVKGGKLNIGLVLLQDPHSTNGYEMIVTGTPEYQWYILADGEWVAVEGANKSKLENAIAGETYKCVASVGDAAEPFESITVRYTDEGVHSHFACGESCTHSPAHENITMYPVGNEEELMLAMQLGGSYYLAYDIEVGKSVSIKTDVTVCLSGHILSAKDNEQAFSILSVSEGVKLVLTDCKTTERVGYIEDGKWIEGEKDGAETVTLTGGMITGGHANLGAAIWGKGDVEIYNVDFVNNTAAERGGAIFTMGELNVSGASFVCNEATLTGGAIHGEGGITFSVTDTAFISNAAKSTTHGGGAMYVNTNAVGTFRGVTLIGNTSHRGGAVALHSGATLTVYSMTAKGNGATANEDGSLGVGGVFILNAATLNLTEQSETDEIIIEGNSAVNGGAIHAEGSATVNISGATFKNNSASASGATSGGAISASSSTLNVTNCTFEGNSVSNGTASSNQHGGAIYANKTTLTVSGTTFTGNTTGYYGGAIAANNGSTVSITGGSVSGSTGSTGAALWFGGCAKVEMSTVSITGNTSKSNGVVYVNSGAENKFTDLTVTNNKSVSGFIYCSGGTLTLAGGTYSGNTATSGGVICLKGGTVIVEKNGENSTVFDGNSATNGGAIYAESGSCTVNGATFTNNTATVGGAIYASGGNLTVTGGSFTSNSATGNSSNKGGGAICATGSVTVNINGVTFTGNKSNYYGGTIAAYDTTLTIGSDSEGNVTVIEDSQGATGAAICYRNGDNNATTGTYTIDGLEVKGTVGTGSGVIYINDGTLTANNLTAINNSSTVGGIIHASGGQSFEIKNSTIEATDTAGAPLGAINLTATGKKLTLENITLTGSGAKINATNKAVVEIRHKTEEEKTSLTEAIILAGSATISYVDISAQ